MNIKLITKGRKKGQKRKEKASQPHFAFLKCNYKLIIFELHWDFLPLLKFYFSFYILPGSFFSAFCLAYMDLKISAKTSDFLDVHT